MKSRRPSKLFKYKGQQLSARDLVKIACKHLTLTDDQERAMATRMRSNIKYHNSVTKAMRIMAQAQAPVSRDEWRKQLSKANIVSIDSAKFDPDLMLKRQIKNLQAQGIPDEEIAIKLKNVTLQ